MKRLTAKKLIEFRAKKSDATRETFMKNFLTPRDPLDEGGGDYWISCLSAIAAASRFNENDLISTKITELVLKKRHSSKSISKTMFQRNIDILENYRKYIFSKVIPARATDVKSELRSKVQLSVRGLRIEVLPSHVFSFKNKGVDEVGVIWFVAQLDGFKEEELGIFLDLAYRYLRTQYKGYTINPKNCIVIDVFKEHEVNYSQVLSGQIPSVLAAAIDQFNETLGSRAM